MSQDSPNNEAQPAAPQYAPPQPAPYYVAPQAPAWQDPNGPANGTAYPAYSAYPGYPPAPGVPVAATNTLAILALISAFVAPFIVPVVLGHISTSQIRRTGEGGRGLALAALILGYIQVAFWALIIAFIIWIGVVAAAPSSM